MKEKAERGGCHALPSAQPCHHHRPPAPPPPLQSPPVDPNTALTAPLSGVPPSTTGWRPWADFGLRGTSGRGQGKGVRASWISQGRAGRWLLEVDSFMKSLTPSLVGGAVIIPVFTEKEKEAQKGKVSGTWWGPGHVCRAPPPAPTTHREPRGPMPHRGHSGRAWE